MSTQKPYSFSLDLYQPSPIPKMEFYQTDRNNCVMNIVLKKQQKGLDMTGLTPYCAILKPDSTLSIYSNDVYVTDLEDGGIQVTLSMQSLGSTGICHAQIFLTSGANTKITLPEFTFKVKKSYEEDGIMESTNEFPIMSSVVNIIANFEEKGDYDNAIQYEVYNMVRYGIGNYINTNSCIGVLPINITNWKLISSDGKNGFSAMETSKFTATANGTSHIPTGFTNYDSTHDNIQVIDSYAGGELIEGINYTANIDGSSIDLIGWTIDVGYTLGFTLYTNLNGTTLQSDIDNAIAQKASLEASIITAQQSTFATEIANGRQGKASILENFQEKDAKITTGVQEVVDSRQGKVTLLANLQAKDTSIALSNTNNGIANQTNINNMNIIADPTLVDNYASTPKVIKIDDIESGIVYTGVWTTVTAPIYPYTTTHVSTNVNNNISYTFTGTGITVHDIKSPQGGQVEIFIDNVSKGIVDRYASSIVVDQIAYSIANLVYGIHTLKIVITETKNVSSVTYSFALDYLEITTNSSLVRDMSLDLITKVAKGDLCINVKDYGAKGDGISDDTLAIQTAINATLPAGVLFFPATGSFYKVTNLTIPEAKLNIRLQGTGMVNSYIKFSGVTSISIQAEMIFVDGLKLVGAGIMTTDSIMFKDERPNNRADFDISVTNCYIQEVETVVYCRGRGVVIENCDFYDIRYHIIKADFPLLAVFTPGVEDTQLYASGYRGFIFRNSRIHYSPCTILYNRGENMMNLSGVLITGNQLEGSTSYIEGYVRNCTVSNNIHYHCGNIREALFMLYGCDNLNIDVNVSGKKIANEGINSYCNKIVNCQGVYNNLTIKANIQDVWKDCFYFNAGGNNLDIQVSANNVCASNDGYSLVRLDTTSAVYDGVNIRGMVTSPWNNFMGVRRSGNAVKNYNINLDIKGDFNSYDNLDPAQLGTRRILTGIYKGTGTASQNINIKYKPSLVQIYSNNYFGVKPTSTFLYDTSDMCPTITITDLGFTVTGTANVIDVHYAYTIQ